jgi:hypothetical protein
MKKMPCGEPRGIILLLTGPSVLFNLCCLKDLEGIYSSRVGPDARPAARPPTRSRQQISSSRPTYFVLYRLCYVEEV